MRYKARKRKRFHSKLQAGIGIILIVAVIFAAFLIFSNLKDQQNKKLASALSTSELAAEVQDTDEEAQPHTDKVYVIKGNDKSSNRYERTDKLSYTDSQKYTDEELDQLDSNGLRITRNEIYARHGRMFLEQDLQNYFDRQSWYVATVSPEKFDDEILNEIENYNINLIVQHEMNY